MTKLIGPFTRIRTLGAGGGAKVFAALDAQGREVAVKVPHTQVAGQPLDREIAAAAHLDHPNIVRVLDYGHTQDRTWLAMESSDHGTLHEHPPSNLEDVDIVVSRVLEALAYAHARHVLHLDLKPSNLLLTDPVTLDVKIADFGQAVASDAPQSSRTTPMGTPQYMAPEQFSDATHLYGPWTDIYALGCMVFEWVYGRPPFAQGDYLTMGVSHARDELPAEPQPLFEVPPAVVGWIRRALGKAHGVRFPGATEAFDAWRRAIANATPEPRRPKSSPAVSANLASLRDPPFVGRSEQLRGLADHFDDALTRREVRLVVLHGAAGAGKSRLARHFAELEEAAGRARWYRATFMDGDLVDPIAVMLSNALGVRGRSVVDAPALIAERLGGGYGVDALMGVVEPTLLGSNTQARLTPQFANRVTFGALQEVAGSRVPIILLDDANRSTNAMDFCEAAMSTPGLSALIVVTVSDHEAHSAAPRMQHWRERFDKRMREVKVGNLAPNEVDGLLSRWVDLTPDQRANIVVMSRGNPLLAVTAVKHDVDGVQPSLATAWGRALAGVDAELPEFGRAALEVAAAIGVRVDEGLWADVMSRMGYPPNTNTLSALERLRVVARRGKDLVFDHYTLRERVLEEASPQWLQEIHAQTARSLAERGADPSLIANHLERSGDPEGPIAPRLAAAYAAAAFESPHVAQFVLNQAIDALTALQISGSDARWGLARLVQLAIDAQSLGFDICQTRAAELAALSEANGWTDILAETLAIQLRLLSALGRYNDALAAGERATMLMSPEKNERAMARLTGEIAGVLHASGRSHEALAHLHDALNVYRSLDDIEGLACALTLAGDILAPEKPTRARECYDEALEFARRMGLRDLEAHITDGIAKVDFAQGKVTDALLGFDRAEITYGSIGATAVWVTRYNRAYVRLRAGQLDGVLGDLDDCAEAFAEIGLHRYSMLATAALLECAALADDQFVIMSQLRVLEAELDPDDRLPAIETPLRNAYEILSVNHAGLARTVRELLAHIRVPLQ
ncbi:MAG: protein kinase [bacterium]